MNWFKKLAAKRQNKDKNIQFSGELKKTKDNFVYLKVPDEIIDGLFNSLSEEGAEKPPYNTKEYNNTGAHISVFYSDEIEKNNLNIKEIGKQFKFEFGIPYSVAPEGWDEMKRVWVVEIKSPELEALRNKYGLSDTINGLPFHVTFALKPVKSRKVAQNLKLSQNRDTYYLKEIYRVILDIKETFEPIIEEMMSFDKLSVSRQRYMFNVKDYLEFYNKDFDYIRDSLKSINPASVEYFSNGLIDGGSLISAYEKIYNHIHLLKESPDFEDFKQNYIKTFELFNNFYITVGKLVHNEDISDKGLIVDVKEIPIEDYMDLGKSDNDEDLYKDEDNDSFEAFEKRQIDAAVPKKVHLSDFPPSGYVWYRYFPERQAWGSWKTNTESADNF